MAELQHKFVTTNGIRMHYVEQGAGPLVVLCHGWPESWYSYRHQIPALAAAGFRVVAPDQRGYGQTDKSKPIDAYNILNLVGDIVGLANSVGADTVSAWRRQEKRSAPAGAFTPNYPRRRPLDAAGTPGRSESIANR